MYDIWRICEKPPPPPLPWQRVFPSRKFWPRPSPSSPSPKKKRIYSTKARNCACFDLYNYMTRDFVENWLASSNLLGPSSTMYSTYVCTYDMAFRVVSRSLWSHFGIAIAPFLFLFLFFFYTWLTMYYCTDFFFKKLQVSENKNIPHVPPPRARPKYVCIVLYCTVLTLLQ